MFYIQRDPTLKNDKIQKYVKQIADADKPTNVKSTSSLSATSLKPENTTNTKVKTFLLTKNIELESKQEELNLLQDKIKQVSILKSMKDKTKTPSFSNLGT